VQAPRFPPASKNAFKARPSPLALLIIAGDADSLVFMPSTFRDVDPRILRVSSSRPSGADPVKLQRQIVLFGASTAGMSPPWVYEGTDGELVIFNGITRATRVAKLAPGTLIRVEVIGKLRAAFGSLPTIGDLLP
jgi:hypothetical protein